MSYLFIIRTKKLTVSHKTVWQEILGKKSEITRHFRPSLSMVFLTSFKLISPDSLFLFVLLSWFSVGRNIFNDSNVLFVHHTDKKKLIISHKTVWQEILGKKSEVKRHFRPSLSMVFLTSFKLISPDSLFFFVLLSWFSVGSFVQTFWIRFFERCQFVSCNIYSSERQYLAFTQVSPIRLNLNRQMNHNYLTWRSHAKVSFNKLHCCLNQVT